MRRKNVAALLALVTVVALVAAACGSGDSSKSGGEGTTAKKGGTPVKGQGFDGTTITLGVITPMSGLAQVIGKPLTNGNDVYWKSKNAAGGVAGKYQVKLVVKDSAYDPVQAGQAFDEISSQVAAFQQILGTQVTVSLMQKLDDQGLAAGPATLDAEWLVEKQLFPIATTYQILAINSVDYYVNQAGGKGKVLCQTAQDDAYGEAGVQGVNYAAQQLGVKITTTARYAGGADKTAAIQQLKDNKCDFVFGTVLATDTSSVISKAAEINFTPQWALMAPAWTPILASGDVGAYMQKYVWVAVIGPNWGDMSVPGMAQMINDLQKYAPDQKPDIYFAFGYAQAWTLDQILEKAVGNGDLSPAGIVSAIGDVGTLKFDGLVPDFTYGSDVTKRQAPPVSTIFQVDMSAPGGLKATNPAMIDYSSQAAKDYRWTKK